MESSTLPPDPSYVFQQFPAFSAPKNAFLKALFETNTSYK